MKDVDQMTAQTTNLMLRNDTILGVCEAIGTDFGFNPNWLRVAFCVPMFWNPENTYMAARASSTWVSRSSSK